MILVDTSIWVDHLRTAEPLLVDALERGEVLGHPSVTGELALGHLAQRALVLGLLAALPAAVPAQDEEVLLLVERQGLPGRGIGWVDVHLLASTLLTPGGRLWTRDRRLAAAARAVGVEAGLED